MRKILMVTSEADLLDAEERVKRIVEQYVLFLEDYPTKTMRSRHGAMGPVAKILQRVKAGADDYVQLCSLAWRSLEMSDGSKGYLHSSQMMEPLEKATKELVELRRRLPLSKIDKVITQISDDVYYERRKKSILFLEKTRQEFIGYLKVKYPTVEALATAWEDKKITDFEKAGFPSRRNEGYQKAKGTRKADIDGFWNSRSELQDVIEEDDVE